MVSDVARLTGVPAQQLALYRATGARLAEAGHLEAVDSSLTVDAVLGYSLAGAPRGVAADLIRWMSRGAAPVVALDVPSGVDATSGDSPGAHVRAATTMTLALPKTGLDVDAVGDSGWPTSASRVASSNGPGSGNHQRTSSRRDTGCA